MSETNHDILFDRNDDQNHNNVTNQSLQLRETRRVVNESPMSEFPAEIIAARKRVVNKLLDMVSIQADINNWKPESIIENPDIIDKDMLTVGRILIGTNANKILLIDIPPITITIDLKNAIKNAFLQRKTNLIQLMIELEMNLYEIEPNIMIMCVETNHDSLMYDLINKGIPVHIENHRCVYQLATYGKLDLIKAILDKYYFSSVPEIVSKICIQAILNNHVHILEYFFTKEAFVGAPDQMFTFFINSIQFGGHLPIIKFFVDNGINIKQQEYKAIHTATQYGQKLIMKYFYEIEAEIINLLTEEQKENFGFVQLVTKYHYIGTETCCNISYDGILIDDTYVRCDKELHYFKENIWNEWTNNKINWTCPLCFSPVAKILYQNIPTDVTKN